MKKFVIKISLAFVIVIVILLIMLWLRTSDGDGTVPSYSFLGGRNPISCEKVNRGIEDSSGKEDRRYIYSFEADYNALCSKADTELIPAGFVVKASVQILSGNESSERYYSLKERFPRGPVWIYIYNNRQYVDLHDLYTHIPKSKHYGLAEKDGWIMVEVACYRGWQWPF